MVSQGCKLPPAGWLCTREPGHEVPCAAIETSESAGTQPSAICFYAAQRIAPDSWLNEPRFEWFRRAHEYAGTKTNAIAGLSKVHPEELFHVVGFMMRELGLDHLVDGWQNGEPLLTPTYRQTSEERERVKAAAGTQPTSEELTENRAIAADWDCTSGDGLNSEAGTQPESCPRSSAEERAVPNSRAASSNLAGDATHKLGGAEPTDDELRHLLLAETAQAVMRGEYGPTTAYPVTAAGMRALYRAGVASQAARVAREAESTAQWKSELESEYAAHSNTTVERDTLRVRIAKLEKQLAAAKSEIGYDDLIIADRTRLLALFDCPAHGPCVPYAIEQVGKLRERVAASDSARDSALDPTSARCRFEDCGWSGQEDETVGAHRCPQCGRVAATHEPDTNTRAPGVVHQSGESDDHCVCTVCGVAVIDEDHAHAASECAQNIGAAWQAVDEFKDARITELEAQRDSALERAKAVDLLAAEKDGRIGELEAKLAALTAGGFDSLFKMMDEHHRDHHRSEVKLEAALQLCIADLESWRQFAIQSGGLRTEPTREALAAGRKALGEKS